MNIFDTVYQIKIFFFLISLNFSLFLYEKLPPLKFNNPEVPILCTRDDTKPWMLAIEFYGKFLKCDLNIFF